MATSNSATSLEETQNFSELFVFGDSLSDTGNLFQATGGLVPNSPPYFEGRFSNGPLTVELLAPQLGLTSNPATNFAVGGAKTGRDNSGDNPALGLEFPGLLDQIDQFVANTGSQGADPDGLYVVWAGGNDFLNPPADPKAAVTAAVNNLTTAVNALASVGAQNVVVPNLPDIGRTPLASANGLTSILRDISLSFNSALELALAGLVLDVISVDLFDISQEIAANPTAFGLSNITDSFLNTAEVVDPDPDPDQFFFWDDVHPTTKVDEIYADTFREAIVAATSPAGLTRNDNNIFSLAGLGDSTTQLLFTLNQINTNFVDEIGVFTVDTNGGVIDSNTGLSLVPGQEGYLEAALRQSQVIFSAPSDIFDLLNNVSITRQLSFSGGTNLGFYLVPNSTTTTAQQELATGQTPEILFAFPSANTNGINYLQSDEITDGGFTLSWEDQIGGGDQSFDDLVLTVEVTEEPQPLGTQLQGEVELLDLRSQTTPVQAELIVNGEAGYNNVVGFYVIDDENGGIDVNNDGVIDSHPGEADYARIAILERLLEFDSNTTVQLTGGEILAPYIIADGTPEEFLELNLNHQPEQVPLAYFPFLEANPDGVDHVRLGGDNTFAFEDLFNGGDLDYNDIVFQVNLSPVV
ncbi:DUF4114 domain-containing protein [Lyngbya aestuarii]|uniref:DUF4114 domain-containing protein n=1 Tax=Lyngbya aestuarii TaxID=118322 RepID=UPI00403DE7A5